MPTLKIAADAPVGATLWSKQSIPFSANCTTNLLSWPGEGYVWRRSLVLSAYGLEFVLTYKGNSGSGAAQIDMGTYISDGTVVSGTVDLTLRKTGATPSSGTVTSGDLYAFTIDGTTDNGKAPHYIRGLSNISFTSYTCDIDTGSRSISVPLGDMREDKFTGIGTTSPDKTFHINLNCTQPSGTYNVALTFNATADSSHAPGVLALTSDANSASGVGIQLLMNGTPVSFNTALSAGVATANTTLSIPMTARYYQTASAVKPGKANGIATFVVSYK
ncbi:fimbrial protein [Trinickia terrae]|nr:fimbrial protein [Trinickia terrae]